MTTEAGQGTASDRVVARLVARRWTEKLARGEEVPYLPPGGLGGFDLVLSYAGGRSLQLLASRLGARHQLRSNHPHSRQFVSNLRPPIQWPLLWC